MPRDKSELQIDMKPKQLIEWTHIFQGPHFVLHILWNLADNVFSHKNANFSPTFHHLSPMRPILMSIHVTCLSPVYVTYKSFTSPPYMFPSLSPTSTWRHVMPQAPRSPRAVRICQAWWPAEVQISLPDFSRSFHIFHIFFMENLSIFF